MLKPEEIVRELDKHIIGQDAAKRAVAVALRNRWRRRQVEEPLRQEITPKNILMIGPTGVGKTEIARRLARLADAPFIKVEATKFTEVGYVGRDVDSIIRDLVEIAIKDGRERATETVKHQAWINAEERVLDAVLPASRPEPDWNEPTEAERESASRLRDKFREKLRKGEIDEREVEIQVAEARPHMEILAPPGMEELTSQIQGMFQSMGNQRQRPKKMRVKDALKAMAEQEALKLVNEEDLKAKAVESVEQNGIVFLDEVDKIASRSETGGSADVSRQGVQRDLLPLVEGTTVSTRYGMVKTDHILFIASGAFHFAKPSDLVPELQGRLPIRVELDSLGVDEFERILTSTDACLIRQYEALLGTENIRLSFAPEAVRRLAEIAFEVNEKTENIGARRLYTVMEKVLEDISFHAPDGEREIVVDVPYVDDKLAALAGDQDLARYVL